MLFNKYHIYSFTIVYGIFIAAPKKTKKNKKKNFHLPCENAACYKKNYIKSGF